MDENGGAGPEDTRPPEPPSGGVEQPPDTFTAPPPSEALAPRPTAGKAVALATALAVVVAAAATAVVLRGGGEGESLDTLVPADAVAYVHANLDPPTGQKKNLRRILDRFPQARRDVVGSTIERLIDQALENTGLRYERDLKPWLGDKAAVALVSPETVGSGREDRIPFVPPRVIVLLAVTNEGKARASLSGVRGLGDVAFVITGGVAYLGQSQADIASFRNSVGRRGALAQNRDYRRALDRVGTDVLGYLWADFTALGEELSSGLGVPFLPGVAGGLGGSSGKGFVALRAEANGIALVGSSISAPGQEPGKGGRPTLLESSPAGLLASLTVFDPARAVRSFLEQVGRFSQFGSASCRATLTQPGQPAVEEECEEETGRRQRDPAAEARAFLQRSFGLDLEDDIYPWLRGELSVVFGGLSGEPGFGLGAFDIGAMIEVTDEAAARRTIDALAGRLPAVAAGAGFSAFGSADGFTVRLEGKGSIVVRRTGDRVVVATNPGYAETLTRAAPAAISGDTVYRRVVGGSEGDTSLQVFVRIDRIREIVEALIPSGDRATYESEVSPFLRAFQALGLRVTQESPTEGSFRLFVALGPA